MLFHNYKLLIFTIYRNKFNHSIAASNYFFFFKVIALLIKYLSSNLSNEIAFS